MKKSVLFFLVAIVVSLCSTQKAKAQVTAITASYFDSSGLYCTTPANVQGFASYYVAGTIQTNDSITVYINYGDGSDTTYNIETQTQGGFVVNHVYTITGNFQISVTLTNTLNTTATTTMIGNVTTITNSCSSLTGLVWLDTDGDCVYDNGESYFDGYLMKARDISTNDEYFGYVQGNGMYYIVAPSGATYEVGMANQPTSLNPVCPSTGLVNQTVSGGSYTNDFSYQCNTVTTTDFSVGGSAISWRPGFNRTMYINAGSNNICVPYPATVSLYLDPQLSYTSTLWGTAPSSTSGPIVWNVSSMSNLLSLNAYLSIGCDQNATLGDTLCNMLVITYTGVTDPNHANDTIEICAPVNNSYDPNIKTVFPQGDGALGLIQPGTELSYVVQFQNTGNDTAYNVTIVDTLSTHLDMSTFQLLSHSHAVNVTWNQDNVMNFRFEGINLPDSNTNEPLSHGYVAYKIKTLPGLTQGTQINNTAHIYFDFNPAIVTNTTLNTIDIPTHVQTVANASMTAQVYPNPANDQFTVVAPGNDKFSVQLFDVLGRPVATSSTDNGKTIINTAALSSGMYMLHINANGKQLTTKLHVQH